MTDFKTLRTILGDWLDTDDPMAQDQLRQARDALARIEGECAEVDAVIDGLHKQVQRLTRDIELDEALIARLTEERRNSRENQG